MRAGPAPGCQAAFLSQPPCSSGACWGLWVGTVGEQNVLWISFEKESLRLLFCSAPTIATLRFATSIVLCSLDLANVQSSKNLGPWDGPSLHAGPRGQGRCRKGLMEWPWQNPGIPALSPRLRIGVPWQKFLFFPPSRQVRGTLGSFHSLGRDGPRPLLGKGDPGGSELGLCDCLL